LRAGCPRTADKDVGAPSSVGAPAFLFSPYEFLVMTAHSRKWAHFLSPTIIASLSKQYFEKEEWNSEKKHSS